MSCSHGTLIATRKDGTCHINYHLRNSSPVLSRKISISTEHFTKNFAQEINGNASFVKLLPTVQEACRQTQNELTFPHHQHDQMDGRNPARSYLHRPHNLLLPHHRCSHMDTFGRPCLCNVRNQSITWQKSLQPYTNTFLFHLYKKIYKWMLKQVRYWENVTAVTLTSPASSA